MSWTDALMILVYIGIGYWVYLLDDDQSDASQEDH